MLVVMVVVSKAGPSISYLLDLIPFFEWAATIDIHSSYPQAAKFIWILNWYWDAKFATNSLSHPNT